jgi:ABC-type transport system involved in cytochrome bd biosynthesis fused ATPase/permease subunit
VTSVSPLLLHHADRIAYLEDGVVAASGTHEELLTTSPGYRSVVARALDEDDEQPVGAAGPGHVPGGGEGR